jgi:flagellar basal-body rod protein FlgB
VDDPGRGKAVTIKVFDRTYDTLAKSLDLRTQKQVVISSNIANADTPGYQAQELDFEGALGKALESNSSIENVKGELYNQINNVVREDGNSVDRDAEMTSMAENQLLYNAAADLVKKKIALLKYAISDGGSH